MKCIIPVLDERQAEKNFVENCFDCRAVLVLVVVDRSQAAGSATEIFSRKKIAEKIVLQLKEKSIKTEMQIAWGNTLKVLIKTAKKTNAKKIFIPKTFFSKNDLKGILQETAFKTLLVAL